jgi:hypothetical protein
VAKLTAEQKIFIIQRLAVFDTPEQVANAFTEAYGQAITRMHVEIYDPTKAAGHKLSDKLRKVFEDTRTTFLSNLQDIPIANKAYRLRLLDKLARNADGKGNAVLTASLAEQAAKEMGEHYTNRQRIEANVHLTGDVGEALGDLTRD